MPTPKPYSLIPIRECGEPLVPIPRDTFALFEPHPYVALGAPYGAASPWMLRSSIINSLQKAQKRLHSLKPGWRIILFDAYRPNEVQKFMVQHELTTLAKAEGLNPAALSESDRERLMVKAFRVWAMPSEDPAMPPPHSTGATFDCTLIDDQGSEVDMGSPIDENSDRSYPDHFARATDAAGKAAHANRVLLHDILYAEGFRRNPGEWWHFSRGDQLAIWADGDKAPQPFAIYGRAK